MRILFPSDICPNAMFDRVDAHARLHQALSQLLGRQAHTPSDLDIGLIDFGSGDFQSSSPGLLHFELLVAQFIDLFQFEFADHDSAPLLACTNQRRVHQFEHRPPLAAVPAMQLCCGQHHRNDQL